MVFSEKLEHWYAEFGRSLPWRGISDPYRIWVSEIILQQTRIEQGWTYYERFVESLPTVEALAAASEEEVLALWQGLGYYSRARTMHTAARQIVEQCGGHFPDSYEGLLSLKGVGRYTAAAVASFAYRLPCPVIDGNVYRFISRLYGIATPIATDRAYSEFDALLRKLMGDCRPDVFNAALMDFGSLQCKVVPQCETCPFAVECVARREAKVGLLPVKVEKRPPTDRWFIYLDMRRHDSLLLHQRTEKDIWRGLWELPLLECEGECSPSEAETKAAAFAAEVLGLQGTRFRFAGSFVHKLTHRTIHATFVRAEIAKWPSKWLPNMKVATAEERGKMPVSRLIDRYLRGM